MNSIRLEKKTVIIEVGIEHFQRALEKLTPSVSSKDLQRYKEMEEKI